MLTPMMKARIRLDHFCYELSHNVWKFRNQIHRKLHPPKAVRHQYTFEQFRKTANYYEPLVTETQLILTYLDVKFVNRYMSQFWPDSNSFYLYTSIRPDTGNCEIIKSIYDKHDHRPPELRFVPS